MLNHSMISVKKIILHYKTSLNMLVSLGFQNIYYIVHNLIP